ncbi:hypothetical protein ACFWBN_37435 [Streptomyces sp. NPDC059989]|uniref:hypothetical protein n=1 Tax=Streptomyces sp. NPDC059989 TaxID=3347026 RepID=UPI003678F70E
MNVHNSSGLTSRTGVGSACHTSSGDRPPSGFGWWEAFHHSTQSNRRVVKSSNPRRTSPFGLVRRLPGRG